MTRRRGFARKHGEPKWATGCRGFAAAILTIVKHFGRQCAEIRVLPVFIALHRAPVHRLRSSSPRKALDGRTLRTRRLAA